MRRRVVCGRGVTIATLWPTIRLSSVDLPTLVRPRDRDEARAMLRPAAVTALFFYSIQRRRAAACSLCFLLPPSATPRSRPAIRIRVVKRLGVIGPARRDQFVNRLGAKMAIGDFLQFGLVIALRGRSADIVGEQSLDHLLGRA